MDGATGEVKWAVEDHKREYFRCAAISPDGRFVASVELDNQCWKLWDSASGALHRAGARHDGTGECVCEVNDVGHRVVQDGCPVVTHSDEGIWSVTFSPCGQGFATGGFDGEVIVWDVQTGKVETRMTGVHPKGVLALCFSSCGQKLASGGWEGSICVWDTVAGALLFRMHGDYRSEDVRSLHFSPTDENHLLSAGDGGFALWDVEKGEMMERTEEGGVFAVFSPNGRTIATASGHGSRDLHLVDSRTGAVRLKMVSHRCLVSCASFSDDGSKLASGSGDGTCKVWDSSTGALLRTITVATPVLCVEWGRDWVQDTLRGVAFAMGHHPRLGAGSRALELEVGVVRMILDRV